MEKNGKQRTEKTGKTGGRRPVYFFVNPRLTNVVLQIVFQHRYWILRGYVNNNPRALNDEVSYLLFKVVLKAMVILLLQAPGKDCILPEILTYEKRNTHIRAFYSFRLPFRARGFLQQDPGRLGEGDPGLSQSFL